MSKLSELTEKHKLPLPGLRNIKTALCILIILIGYQATGRENEFIAITVAVLCLQDSVNKSLIESRNRIISTIMGGLYGLLFIISGLNNDVITKDIGIAISTILIIYICNLLKNHSLIINSLFVFILVVSVPANEMSPLNYATRRIEDTLIGIIVAVIINRYFFPPKVKKVNYKKSMINHAQLLKDSRFIKGHSYKLSTWAGGEALELLIYPKDAIYEDFNFKYRLSIAETVGEVLLTYTPNYYRRTMILSGEATYEHEGSHTIKLKQFDQDYYKGDVKTKSKGVTTNFNMMISKGYESDIATIKNGETTDLLTITHDELNTFEVAHYYSLYDNTVLSIESKGEIVYTHILNKDDSIVFKHLYHYAIDEFFVTLRNDYIEDDVVLCVRANIK